MPERKLQFCKRKLRIKNQVRLKGKAKRRETESQKAGSGERNGGKMKDGKAKNILQNS